MTTHTIPKPRKGPAKPAGFLTMRSVSSEKKHHAQIVKEIRKGLLFDDLRLLETEAGLSREDMSTLLAISSSTLTRRQKEGRLRPQESDRLVRFALLKDAALEMMHGNGAATRQWLRTPLEVLGGETPLEHADTELGARDVEDLIRRTQHGIFS